MTVFFYSVSKRNVWIGSFLWILTSWDTYPRIHRCIAVSFILELGPLTLQGHKMKLHLTAVQVPNWLSYCAKTSTYTVGFTQPIKPLKNSVRFPAFLNFSLLCYFYLCVMHQMCTKWMRNGEVLLVRRHVSSPEYESACMNLICGFHTKSCRKSLFFATNFSTSRLFNREVSNVYNFSNVTPAWREP